MSEQTLPQHVDVVVVGAGLSGIGATYRLQTECPEKTCAVLEARDTLGGTWDLFRYPGVRSDSDMYTLGYPFRPWTDDRTLADGPAILDYLRETAQAYGIDQRIAYRSRVLAAAWSTDAARWTLTVDQGGTRRTVTCRFLYLCAGYYDYEQGHAPEFPGVESFAGTVVHPQFWPDDLDVTDRRVVVIGSGATAVTLVPALAERAGHVTMLQRTATWISPVPRRDAVAERLRRVLPRPLAHRAIRAKNIALTTGFYQFCRRRPQTARRLLTGLASKIIGDAQLVADHFTPAYDPWDQRLCAIPGADLFKAVRQGTADVVTDRIETFVPEGIRLASGRVLPADVVVTATGLRLRALGGLALQVDGEPVDLSRRFMWRGTMISGVPNLAVCLGYTNASWTLRADLTSRLVCKVLKHLDRRGYAAVAPAPDADLAERPLWELTSGYVQRSVAAFPKQGSRDPWRMRQNYLVDAATLLRTDLDRTLVPVGGRAPARAAG